MDQREEEEGQERARERTGLFPGLLVLQLFFLLYLLFEFKSQVSFLLRTTIQTTWSVKNNNQTRQHIKPKDANGFDGLLCL